MKESENIDPIENESKNNPDEPSEIKGFTEKQNKQILYSIILMCLVVLIILAVPFIIKNFISKFEYKDMEFQKTKTGDLFLYSIKIPLLNQDKQITNYYNMDLREDPRELDYINVDIPDNSVLFKRDNVTYVSLDSDAPICEDNVISVVNLVYFLREFGGLEIKGAADSPEVATEKKLAYATCENSPNNTVISIQHSNETAIKQKSKNCYEITYKDCEIDSAIEKFILIILEKYMSYLKE